MNTLSHFVSELKKSLRQSCNYAVVEGQYYSTLTGSDPSEIDWEELNSAIDAFCAEFKAKNAKA